MWFEPIVPHLKGLHIVMLVIWCAGLFALPLMLGRHDPAVGQADYSVIRRATHHGYTFVVTPAAVIAIASGAALIFIRDLFELWMFAKLVGVAGLVAFHAWVGATLVEVAETKGSHMPPAPLVPTLILMLPITLILALVLAKPELGEISMPEWLMTPRGIHLPLDVPN